jgi:hypothetical protein
MFAQRALALSADFISATQLNTTQTGTMSPSSVEHLLTQKLAFLHVEKPQSSTKSLRTYARLPLKYSSSGRMEHVSSKI